jgi:hypothetical protein
MGDGVTTLPFTVILFIFSPIHATTIVVNCSASCPVRPSRGMYRSRFISRTLLVPPLASKNIRLFDWTPDKLEHPEMSFSDSDSSMFYQFVATQQGICFVYSTNGFWFLPYSDIDAYLKSHGGDRSPATPASTAKASPSSNNGDADYDPGDPTSFR